MTMTQLDANQAIKTAFDDTTGALKQIQIGGTLVPEHYDKIELTYSGSNITVVTYKLAGAVVATLTLAYSGSNVTSITRT